MFSIVDHIQTCKSGRVKLTVVLNTDYCQTFKIFHYLNYDYSSLILKQSHHRIRLTLWSFMQI